MSNAGNVSASQALLCGRESAMNAQSSANADLAFSSDPAYKKLKDYHREHVKELVLRKMFESDPERFNKYR